MMTHTSPVPFDPFISVDESRQFRSWGQIWADDLLWGGSRVDCGVSQTWHGVTLTTSLGFQWVPCMLWSLPPSWCPAPWQRANVDIWDGLYLSKPSTVDGKVGQLGLCRQDFGKLFLKWIQVFHHPRARPGVFLSIPPPKEIVVPTSDMLTSRLSPMVFNSPCLSSLCLVHVVRFCFISKMRTWGLSVRLYYQNIKSCLN